MLGAGAAELAGRLRDYPLDAIYVNEDPAVDAFVLDPVVDYLQAAAQSARAVVAAAFPTRFPAATSPAASSRRLGAGIVADVVDVRVEGAEVICVSPKLGGAMVTECALRPGDYGVVTVRPNAFAAASRGRRRRDPAAREAGQRVRGAGRT